MSRQPSAATAARGVSRRRFLAASAAAALAPSGALLAAPGPAKYKYVDMHTHLGAFHVGRSVTVKVLLDWMDRHDVERAAPPAQSASAEAARINRRFPPALISMRPMLSTKTGWVLRSRGPDPEVQAD